VLSLTLERIEHFINDHRQRKFTGSSMNLDADVTADHLIHGRLFLQHRCTAKETTISSHKIVCLCSARENYTKTCTVTKVVTGRLSHDDAS
jgi:hypothetical protein